MWAWEALGGPRSTCLRPSRSPRRRPGAPSASVCFIDSDDAIGGFARVAGNVLGLRDEDQFR